MRGRLIVPFLAEIYRLDLAATAADPDGAGPLVSGFDEDFREPVVLPGGVSARREFAAIQVPCQIEEEAEDQLNQRAAGNDPSVRTVLVFHFQDLENMSLIDANGTALIKVNDRLTALFTSSGSLIERLDVDGQGLYCVRSEPASFGLVGGQRNLLLTTWARRSRTAPGVG